jgi:hypothetical protein
MTRWLWLFPLFSLLLSQSAGAATPDVAPNSTEAQEIAALLGAQSPPASPAPLDFIPQPTERVTCIPEPVCYVDNDCAEFCGQAIPHCTWINCPNRILACICEWP